MDEPGVRFGIAHAGLVTTALIVAAASLPGPVALGAMAVSAGAGGRRLSLGWRSGIALSAWAIFTGFLHNDLGLLTFAPPDLLRLAALLLVCAVWRRRRWDRLGP